MTTETEFSKLKNIIAKQKSLIEKLKKTSNPKEETSIKNQIKKYNNSMKTSVEKITLNKKLPSQGYSQDNLAETTYETHSTKTRLKKQSIKKDSSDFDENFENLQQQYKDISKQTIKRFKKREEKKQKRKVRKLSSYVKFASKLFSGMSLQLSQKDFFRNMKKDLNKSNLHFLPRSYISMMLFTTLLSIIIAFFAFIFFLFFNVSASTPFISSVTESFGARLLKTFWIIFVVPLATFLFMFVYPSLERKSTESKIDNELPFVAIHLAAISDSLIEPGKMFRVVVSTKEYPQIEKEFIKIINKINVYGYNLVNALRDTASNCASKKLADLFNGLSTTITSGGELQEFFEKRSRTLLFDYRLAREKYIRTAETFMDIYISVVIAAPMIFLLLLIIIKVSELGISLSTRAITLLMVVGVALINIVFLVFLSISQPKE